MNALVSLVLLLAAAPARTETVRIEAADSLVLVGTLALPARTPAPAIVLLHGSEAGRRDNAFFRAVRDRLVGDGFAVLGYDKRGVGESGGTYVETPDLLVPARDAASAVAFLAARPDIARIGIIGISQGGWAAPLAATLEPRVAFVVAVSEPGMSPLEQSGFQRASEWIEQGLAPADAQAARAMRTLLFEYWHGDVPRVRADSAWAAVRAQPWFGRVTQSEELFARLAPYEHVPPASALPPAFARAVREHYFHDPIPVAERLRVPVLHLYGEADRHLPVAESAAAFRAAYARAGNAEATIRVIAHAGHGMQAVTADAECFGCLPEARLAWAPAAGWLDTLSTWLEKERR